MRGLDTYLRKYTPNFLHTDRYVPLKNFTIFINSDIIQNLLGAYKMKYLNQVGSKSSYCYIPGTLLLASIFKFLVKLYFLDHLKCGSTELNFCVPNEAHYFEILAPDGKIYDLT